MAKGIFIPVDGQAKLVAVGELDSLKELVGGWIEYIHIDADHHGYVNEEGRLLGLPPNLRATLLWQESGHFSDCLVGPLIILGSRNAKGRNNGDDHDVKAAMIEKCQELGWLTKGVKEEV
jgi:hypothetical protein